MKPYRKFETVLAIQYHGEPIPDVTCEGTSAQRDVNGCDNTRGHLPHVHTRAIGGLTVIQPGDWIMPVPGGPFSVLSDPKFRAYYEVLPDDPVLDEPLLIEAHAPDEHVHRFATPEPVHPYPTPPLDRL